ncbi:Trafficking protein particle complex 8 [Phlyctochytrium planicorne]|nr:Trafficking protein particle complex 8 [Phlyctochytrium planicorne]
MGGLETVRSRLAPAIAVLASDDVLQTLALFGAKSVVDFLSPFGYRIDGKVHVRDSQGQSSSVDNFNLRFVQLDALEGALPDDLRQNLLDAIKTSTAAMEISDAVSKGGAPFLESATTDVIFNVASIEELTPWYTEYRNLICKSIGAMEHETFDHPVACLFVTTTANADPVDILSRMYPDDPSKLPPIFQKGFMDPQISLKHYLLIHDSSSFAVADAKNTFSQVQKKFGLGCHFLALNTAEGEAVPFKKVSPLLGSGGSVWDLPTVRISEPDVKAIDQFIREFLVQSILPHMERNVQHWNEQVASARRGITGRLFSASKRYFGNQAKPASSPTNSTENTALYSYNSQELILRKLADYSFMLRDYRFAYSVYETVRKDFQGNDRALKHYAGSQVDLESDSNIRGSLDSHLESAISSYLDANSPILATRATMFIYEIFKHRNQYRDAPNILLRMIGDDSDLRSALLLEQAAFCYAKSSPAMIRKYAFYIVLASYRFNKCTQWSHADRCYNLALDLYKEKDWVLIEDHIRFALGKLSSQLDNPAGAIRHLTQLLHHSQQPSHIQEAYVSEFLNIYKDHASSVPAAELEEILQLPLPSIKDSSVRVSLLESRRPMHVAIEDEVWESMEKDMLEETSRPGTKITGSFKLMKSAKDGNMSVGAVGEPVFVEFEVTNPLNITLQLSDVSLLAEFKDGKEADTAAVDSSLDVDRLVFENFDLECLTSVNLDPSEKRLIQLKVFPKKEGEITIKGVRFMLFNVVPNIVYFKRKGARLNTTQDQRMTAAYAEDQSLHLKITAPLPILDVVFHSFPESLLSGQVERSVLEINNKGNRGLKNLVVKLSHPSFFSFGTPDQMDQNAYPKSGASDASSKELGEINNELFNSSVIPIQLPETTSENTDSLLKAGMTTIIPVWVRGDRIGKHIFRFLFIYKSEDVNDQTSYRKLLYTLTMQVTPSLRINAFTRPSTRELNEFILGVEVENLQQGAPIKLRQITALASSWQITSMDGSPPLQGKQTAFAYFRFKRLQSKPDYVAEDETTNAVKAFIYGDESVSQPYIPLNLRASSVSLDGNFVDCSSPNLQNLSLNSRVQWRKHSLNSHYPGIPSEKLRKMFTLYYTDDIDIALFWEAPPTHSETLTKFGHHYIIGINLGLQFPLQLHSKVPKNLNEILAGNKSLYAATIKEKKDLIQSLLRPKQKDVSPVRFLLASDFVYTHNFSTGSLQVPIKSRLHNTSWSNPISYNLEMQSPDINALQ